MRHSLPKRSSPERIPYRDTGTLQNISQVRTWDILANICPRILRKDPVPETNARISRRIPNIVVDTCPDLK